MTIKDGEPNPTALVVQKDGDQEPGAGFFRDAVALHELAASEEPPKGEDWVMSDGQRDVLDQAGRGVARALRHRLTPSPRSVRCAGWPTASPPSPVPTSASTPTTRSTGTPGATRPSLGPARRTARCLVSIGYSACHWCHVMAHESFEDDDTADLMNRLFVNVKVDREERPDVDGVYMDAVQAMTGHGGWPLTIFVTPDGKPFYGGTYFPKESRHGLPSFRDVCRAVDEHWRNHRDDATAQAERLTEAVARSGGLEAEGVPGPETLDAAYRALRSQHDEEWGGFGRAPKFPQTMSHELLLRAHARNQEPTLLEAVVTSLDAMASGGMYDHLGGGFARYSVDAFWMVPHFEKMLYDQALLARLYLHAWQVTGESRFRQVLAETVTYVLRDLRHPDGGLYSAEDADSEGEEGTFYVWRPEAIREVLGDDADLAIEWYGVTPQGNFEGSNILHRPVRGDLVRPAGVEAAPRGALPGP